MNEANGMVQFFRLRIIQASNAPVMMAGIRIKASAYQQSLASPMPFLSIKSERSVLMTK